VRTVCGQRRFPLNRPLSPGWADRRAVRERPPALPGVFWRAVQGSAAVLSSEFPMRGELSVPGLHTLLNLNVCLRLGPSVLAKQAMDGRARDQS
jgi:hypothetical protein